MYYLTAYSNILGVLHAQNPIITPNIEKTQNTGFKNIIYINIFHENDDNWLQRDYSCQIHLLAELVLLANSTLCHYILMQHHYNFV
jgi:hypothetical protein